MRRWDRPEYQRISSVEQSGNLITVHFEDGSLAETEVEKLLSPEDALTNRNAVDHNAFELIFQTTDNKQIEIPWSTVRTLTDRDFGVYLARIAEDEAKQIGIRLRELRTSRGISSKELALRAGITPQSLSRIENGRHDVVFTTLRKILAGMSCSLQDLSTPNRPIDSLRKLATFLVKHGFSRDFIAKRLFPKTPASGTSDTDEMRALQRAVGSLNRIYGWSIGTILAGRPLVFDKKALELVKFKGYGQANEIRATAYTLYAHWLAVQVVEATPEVRLQRIPRSPREVRNELLIEYGEVSFRSLLSYLWGLGIVVIPLTDQGIFHGACWKIGDRIAIVMKQNTDFQARWLFDLAHEFAHAILHLSDKTTTILELAEITPFVQEKQEFEASDFAEELLFQGRAEHFADRCVRRAKGNLRNLKSAVVMVANKENIAVDLLANYMAFRLSMQGENWWGAANNLQINTPAPADIAREELMARIVWDRLNPQDRSLLRQAIEG